MVAIDRSHQELIMGDGTRVPYDHLILCTGQQFQVLKFLPRLCMHLP